MDFDWIWKAILIVLAGTFLLRIAGRKSISQMTLAQTVIMIAIGSLLIQPVAGENVWTTIGVGAVLVLTLIVIEYGQVKADWMESLITGKAKVLIDNGNLNEKNLSKLRLTVDQLEMKLRQLNVSKISDVHYATLEPNGQLGYTLKQAAQPATQKQFQQISNEIKQLQQSVNGILSLYNQFVPQQNMPNSQQNQANTTTDLFTEVANKTHQTTPPKHLQ